MKGKLQYCTAAFLALSAIMLSVSCTGRAPAEDEQYLGETAPGNTPKAFPLSVDTSFFAAERIAISDDGKNIYYSEIKAYYPIRGENIKRYSFSGGKWNGPTDLFTGFAPALSVSGDTMFLERKNRKNVSRTCISVRKGKSWEEPVQILKGIDSAHYFQSTARGNYYISTISGKGAGLRDWCRVDISGKDTVAVSLGRPLNTSGDNLDFFVARDESYMILTNRPGMAISYKKEDGSWTNPRSLGPKINFGLGSWGPWVTADNKYLFYTTGTKPDYSDVAVYWVRIDALIDSLKNTNLNPYVNNLIVNQTAAAGRPFTFTVPENIFADEDSRAPLTYSARMPDGSAIPSWLSFNSETKTFSGTPREKGQLMVFVFVTDTEKGTAYCPLTISVETGSDNQKPDK